MLVLRAACNASTSSSATINNYLVRIYQVGRIYLILIDFVNLTHAVVCKGH